MAGMGPAVSPRRGAALWQWPLLVIFAASATWAFGVIGLHGAPFLAPMLAGIIFACMGSPLRIPMGMTLVPQAIIGCMVARSLDGAVIGFMFAHGLAVLLVILATGFVSCLVAWGLTRFSPIDAASAAWGSMPGASGIMVIAAAENGGDARLVAFMQYIRVALVVASASLVSAAVTHFAPHAGDAPPHAVAAAVAAVASPGNILATLALAIAGAVLGKLSRIPAGPLLVSAVLGAILFSQGIIDIGLPMWFAAIAYGMVGLFVGLQFNRLALIFALRNLPAIALAVIVLVLLCALVGVGFAWLLGFDPLTGYLATSPGGLDSMMIIALESHANMSVVVALQTIRFFAVMLMAPYLVRLMDRFLSGTERHAD